MHLKDWIEGFGVFIALLTFMWSVKTENENSLREHRDRQEAIEQSRKDLRWKQTNEAQASIRRLTNCPCAKDAMTLLDWNGRHFLIQNGSKQKITWETMRTALRTTPDHFSSVEVFIRDTFDCLFDQFELIQQQIENEIFLRTDVLYPIEYYSSRIMHPNNFEAFSKFLIKYDYPGAMRLIESMVIRNPTEIVDIEEAARISELPE